MPWRVILLLASMPFMVHARDLSLEETRRIEERFVRTQKSTHTLRADFEQTIRFPGMRTPVVSRGEFLYRAPDDIRINFTDPAGDYLLLSGDTLEIARGGKAPVRKPSTHLSAKALVALRNVLRGTPEDTDGRMERKISSADGGFTVSITPVVRSARMPEKIENRVDADSLMLQTMTITLPHGGFMEFRFSRSRRDVPVDGDLFNMKS